ncbi:hypothetical protein NC653_003523 [Populus alba x Populus x berolinensis]|uniref:Uncharacterized protein n=1 Tax=Populus alba x Populus x berolinensis TaxID=444605 RepID=A0AAD6RRP5_9ROSI|nr:hypothetical protein NC653_003523 [Populus alba x Populus x berolinensis]
MSPLQSNLPCCSSFRLFDELQWVTNTRRTIEADHLEDDSETSISIFNVPKALMSTDPDSYAPQQLSLGPYHFSRLELHDMDTYKFSAAKRSQDLLQSLKFQDLVEQLMKLESKIRACYNKYLNLNSETLAWMMAIDASFLLEFLQVYALRGPKMLSEVSSGMPHFLEYSYRKSSCNAILRDIVMLENQIPLFTLRKVLEFRSLSLESADDMLYSMLMGSCKELSPFKTLVRLPVARVLEHAHLLDLLYHIIVPKVEESVNIPEEVKDHTKATQENEEPSAESQNVSSSIDQPPLVEEITIPSVTQLSKCGVRFVPSKGSISTINFDKKTCTFYLPTVSLDVNSDVVLRNLVAYEASNASGPMVFTRYTELMNGIIDTEEDAKILRERGIILNHLKNDEEVANVWNGMSRSIRLTKVPFLDKAIEDVNKYHDGLFKVKVEKFMKQHVFSSWKLLTLLASILLLLLACLQALCSVYDCVRLFHIQY